MLFEYNYVLCWISHFFYKQLGNYIITSNWEATDTAFEPNLNQAIEPTALPQLLTMTVFLVILIVPISWEGLKKKVPSFLQILEDIHVPQNGHYQ